MPVPEDPNPGCPAFSAAKVAFKCHALKGRWRKGWPDLGKIDLGDTLLDLAGKLLTHAPTMTAGMERARVAKAKPNRG